MNAQNTPSVVVRTERGLTVHGTRLTLYQLMDCIIAGWTDEEIKEWYALSDDEYEEITAYINTHQPEFESEYRAVVQRAAEAQVYWEHRNWEHRLQRTRMPLAVEKEALYAKLREQQLAHGPRPANVALDGKSQHGRT